MARRIIELPIGFRSGKLKVIGDAPKHPSGGNKRYLCRCDCGNEKMVTASNLDRLETVSCGCKITEVLKLRNTTHNQSKTNTYKIWKDMVKRCNNSNHSQYHNYGGRGITLCIEWTMYENFIRDMGERPSIEYSLDRIDNDKGYSKENCRWATDFEQRRNKRTNVFHEYKGSKICSSDLAKILGISCSTISHYIKKGKSIDVLIKKYGGE